MYYNYFPYQNNTRLWLPLLAGAAIITAPFWLGGRNNNCCNNQQFIPYPQSYPYPYPVPYPQSYPYPYPYPVNSFNQFS